MDYHCTITIPHTYGPLMYIVTTNILTHCTLFNSQIYTVPLNIIQFTNTLRSTAHYSIHKYMHYHCTLFNSQILCLPLYIIQFTNILTLTVHYTTHTYIVYH